MKISRKNLKRLITENLKDEESTINEVNLRKYQKILSKAKKAQAKDGSPEYAAVVRASQELSAMRYGDNLPGTNKKAKPGPFKKKNSPRYKRADAILDALIDFYKDDDIAKSDAAWAAEKAEDEALAARRSKPDRERKQDNRQDSKGSSQTQPDAPGTGGRYTKTDNFPIQRGHRDKTKGHIAAVQRKIGAKPDGFFGPNTEKALKNFTKSIGIGPAIIITKSNYDLITNSEQPS